MGTYELIDEKYILPTPAGAYYATSSNKAELSRGLLLALITQPKSQLLTIETLCGWIENRDQDFALEVLNRMQSLDWLESYDDSHSAPTGPLEHILPPLLAGLCSTQKALLADLQGFHLASHGFTHEAAEELSALSADLASIRLRHGDLLFNNLNIKTHALGLIDAAGNSQLGFWPLYIGKHCFTLVMSGIPRFNQPGFTDFIWVLTHRYAESGFVSSAAANDISTHSKNSSDITANA